MRFQRNDGLKIDPVEAGKVEIQLQEVFGFYIEVSENGQHFDADLEKHGIGEESALSAVDKSVYKVVRSE